MVSHVSPFFQESTLHGWCGSTIYDVNIEPEEPTPQEIEKQKVAMRREEDVARFSSLTNLCTDLTSDNATSWKRWRLGKFMESEPIKLFFCSLVALNGILIGVQTDHASDADAWKILEVAFISIFSFEILAKILAFKWLYWVDSWNCVDFVIIFVSIIELLLSAVGGYTSSGISAFRLIRILRVIRVVSFVQKLNVIVEAFVRAMASVFWVGALMTMVLYMFAILAKTLFGDSGEIQREAPYVAHQFSTIPLSMMALFQIMTFDSWASNIAW